MNPNDFGQQFQLAKQKISNTLKRYGTYATDQAKQMAGDYQTARDAGLAMAPIRQNPQVEQFKEKNIYSLPVVGGAIKSLTQQPEQLTMAINNLYARQQTPQDMKLLRQNQNDQIVNMAGMTAPVFKGKGGYVHPEDARDLGAAYNALKSYTPEQFVNDKFGAIRDIENLFKAYGPKLTKKQTSAYSIFDKAKLLAQEFARDVQDRVYRK